MASLWQNKNYLISLPFIVATNIYEYDIKKANISILLHEGAIDKSEYNRLYDLPKLQRQIEIGYMIRNNPEIDSILSNGIKEMKKRFFESNNIEDHSIVSIKNDAVFIMNDKPAVTVFDNVEFVLKNTYSSFYRLNKNIEIYFRSDRINNTMQFDVKGINDEILSLHQNHMCSWLAQIMYSIEVGDIQLAISDIQIFFDDFVNRRLPIEFYRTFDSVSGYVVVANGQPYLLPYATEYDKGALNITTNVNIIREMYSICTQLYFSRNK